MTIPFFPKVIRGAENAAQKFGYSVIAIDSNDDSSRQREVVSLLRSQRVEGILLVVASGKDSLAQLPKLLDSGIPIVCLDRLPGGVDVDSVCVEDRAAAELGTAHLIENGHSRIAIITGDLTLKNEQQRLLGYQTALQTAGLAVPRGLVWEATLHQEHAFEICHRNLSRIGKRPTALFATNGVTGMGALRAIMQCGLQTPDDIAFITFDELAADDLFRPAITSIVQPAFDIGYRAAEILMERLQTGKLAARQGPRIEIRLPATLKVRESSVRLQSTVGHSSV